MTQMHNQYIFKPIYSCLIFRKVVLPSVVFEKPVFKGSLCNPSDDFKKAYFDFQGRIWKLINNVHFH